MVFGTLTARLLGNMLAGKGINRAGYGSKGDGATTTRQGRGMIRAGYRPKRSVNKTFIPEIRMNLDLMEFIQELIYQIK